MKSYSMNYFLTLYVLLSGVFVAYCMDKGDVKINQLRQQIQQHYNFSCNYCFPNYSFVSLKDPTLFWKSVVGVGRDVLCLILGCKSVIILTEGEFNDLMRPLIKNFVLHETMPIKIISLQSPYAFRSLYAYDNNPTSQKNAYLIMKNETNALYNNTQPNDFLIGYLLGYSEEDIELYYSINEPKKPDAFLILNDVIFFLRESCQYYSNYPTKSLTISATEVSNFKHHVEELRSQLQQVKQEEPNDSRNQDFKKILIYLEKLLANIEKTSGQDQRPILEEILSHFESESNKYQAWFRRDWPKSESYQQFLKDKESARVYLREHEHKTIDEISQEIEQISKHKIIDELSNLKHHQ